jgi:hypothetical protein
MNSKPTVSFAKSDDQFNETGHLDPLSEIDAEIIRAIRNIRYGSVEITIHDSRVVQIERKEKRRFEGSRRLG